MISGTSARRGAQALARRGDRRSRPAPARYPAVLLLDSPRLLGDGFELARVVPLDGGDPAKLSALTRAGTERWAWSRGSGTVAGIPTTTFNSTSMDGAPRRSSERRLSSKCSRMPPQAQTCRHRDGQPGVTACGMRELKSRSCGRRDPKIASLDLELSTTRLSARLGLRAGETLGALAAATAYAPRRHRDLEALLRDLVGEVLGAPAVGQRCLRRQPELR